MKNKTSNWSLLSQKDYDYIVNEYNNLKPIAIIAKELNFTIDRIHKLLKMNNIEVLSKSEFYEQLNNKKYVFEEYLIKDYIDGKLSINDICKKYNIGYKKVDKIIKRNNIPLRTRSEITKYNWKTGKRKSSNSNKNGSKDIYNTLYLRWVNNAKSRKYPFNVTVEYLQNLLEKQEYRCALTGIKLLCPKTYLEYYNEMKGDWRLLSLDRIDSNEGYIEGNVQFVCSWINLAKGSNSNETILDIIKEIKTQV